MDDYVESLYAAWPLRLHLVGTDGRLLYVGGAGPRNYNPSELESAVRATEIILDVETLEKLDKIFPGPGGEAPYAYAW